jgi:hypothetical protein
MVGTSHLLQPPSSADSAATTRCNTLLRLKPQPATLTRSPPPEPPMQCSNAAVQQEETVAAAAAPHGVMHQHLDSPANFQLGMHTSWLCIQNPTKPPLPRTSCVVHSSHTPCTQSAAQILQACSSPKGQLACMNVQSPDSSLAVE